MTKNTSKENNAKYYNMHYEDNKWIEYDSDKYMVIAAKSHFELIREGRIQIHALFYPKYSEQVEERKIIICFIRKKSEPDKPYFAVKIQTEGKLIDDISGDHNAVPKKSNPNDAELISFINAWMKEKGLSLKDNKVIGE